MTSSFGNERTANTAEKHELGHVMIVFEGPDLLSIRSDRDAFGDDSPPQWKLDRLADRTKGHRKQIIVL